MTTEVRYIEVVGNDGTSQRAVARRTVEQDTPGITVLSVSFFGRGTSGAPVYAVEYEQ